MEPETAKVAPLPSVRRLPAYLRFLQSLKAHGRDVVSCTHIADELGLVSTQVRKDLALTGIVGKPKVGYSVPDLIGAIQEFLGWNNTTDAFLVGAGSLGSALLGYSGFQEYGLNIVAAFDVDPAKIGEDIHGREVFPLEKLHDLALRMHVLIGVLTVPATAAQDVATFMVLSGIRAGEAGGSRVGRRGRCQARLQPGGPVQPSGGDVAGRTQQARGGQLNEIF